MTDPDGGTAEELDRWLEETFGGPEHITGHLPAKPAAVMEMGAPGEDEDAVANRPRGTDAGNADLARFVQAWNGLPGEHSADRWRLLSVEARQALRDGWTRFEEDAALQRAAEADSIVPELAGPLGPPPREPQPDRAGPSSTVLVLGIGAVVTVLLLLGLVLLGGGDGDDIATGGATEEDADAPTDGGPAGDDDGGAADDGEEQQAGDDAAALPIDVLTSDGTASYQGPTELPSGGAVTATVTVLDTAGQPVAGVPWFLTIGDPPSSPDATHAEATTDADGVATFRITVPATSGPSVLWTSDGTEAWEISPVDVTDG